MLTQKHLEAVYIKNTDFIWPPFISRLLSQLCQIPDSTLTIYLILLFNSALVAICHN